MSSSLMRKIQEQNQHFHQLSQLLLAPDDSAAQHEAVKWFSSLAEAERARVLETADTHHVIVRAFRVLQKRAGPHGDEGLAQWAAAAVEAERDRAQKAVTFLNTICDALATTGRSALVIKSLEHWPDLGSDLDLLALCDDQTVVGIMTKRFHATVLDRSWGDRLAHKWNFKVPGLPEAVEIHVGRLGQTGEHVDLARRIAKTSVVRDIHECGFRVPSAEGVIVLCTLQRMYRHFYLRLCDIVDAATLVEQRDLDYAALYALSDPAGIWPGVATYLRVISDYLSAYRGSGIEISPEVSAAAQFGGEELFCRGDFLRIPIAWRGAKLYTMQLSHSAFRGNVPAVLRLSLLPCLGAAAALEYKATGSDKGVW